MKYCNLIGIEFQKIMVSFNCKTGQEDGDFRLVPQPQDSLNHLEVYHSGSWGRVCTQGWAIRESVVLCTQLGFRFVGNWDAAAVGTPTVVGLRDVHCHGDESSILDCEHSPLGEIRNCSEGLVMLYCTDTVGKEGDISEMFPSQSL